MPGRLHLTTSLADLCRRFGAASDLPPSPTRPDIAPGEAVPVLVPGLRIEAMRWGVIPVGRVNARGRPVMETIVNARSETVFHKTAFAGTGRGVVLVDGWYEWTGEGRRKQRWRIAAADGAPLAVAAITDTWAAPGGAAVPQVAPLTRAPNADLAPIHDRMPVLLDAAAVAAWLTGTPEQAAALTGPWPDGRLAIAPAAP
jgi:putative SOS response-associated peptidase YedK